MAMADYRLCDACGSKCFYDANLNYEFEESEYFEWDEIDKTNGYRLDYLGDWACICKDCVENGWAITIQKV